MDHTYRFEVRDAQPAHSMTWNRGPASFAVHAAGERWLTITPDGVATLKAGLTEKQVRQAIAEGNAAAAIVLPYLRSARRHRQLTRTFLAVAFIAFMVVPGRFLLSLAIGALS